MDYKMPKENEGENMKKKTLLITLATTLFLGAFGVMAELFPGEPGGPTPIYVTPDFIEWAGQQRWHNATNFGLAYWAPFDFGYYNAARDNPQNYTHNESYFVTYTNWFVNRPNKIFDSPFRNMYGIWFWGGMSRPIDDPNLFDINVSIPEIKILTKSATSDFRNIGSISTGSGTLGYWNYDPLYNHPPHSILANINQANPSITAYYSLTTPDGVLNVRVEIGGFKYTPNMSVRVVTSIVSDYQDGDNRVTTVIGYVNRYGGGPIGIFGSELRSFKHTIVAPAFPDQPRFINFENFGNPRWQGIETRFIYDDIKHFAKPLGTNQRL